MFIFALRIVTMNGIITNNGKFKNGGGCVVMLGRSGVTAMNLCRPLTSLNAFPIFIIPRSVFRLSMLEIGKRAPCLPGKHQHK